MRDGREQVFPLTLTFSFIPSLNIFLFDLSLQSYIFILSSFVSVSEGRCQELFFFCSSRSPLCLL